MVRRLFGRGGDDDNEKEGPSGTSRRVLSPGAAPASGEPTPSEPEESAARQSPDAVDRGMVLVRHPDGTESRVLMGMKPVTIGRWEKCDITIDDEALRPVHVRIAPMADGEFRVHGLAAPSLRPFATNIERPDEFMLVHSGDEVTLPGEQGEYTIHFLSSEAAASLDSGGGLPAGAGEAATPAPQPASEQAPQAQAESSDAASGQGQGSSGYQPAYEQAPSQQGESEQTPSEQGQGSGYQSAYEQPRDPSSPEAGQPPEST